LDKVDGRIVFIGLSLVLRLFEAAGGSAVFIATYTLCNRLYPGSVATVFVRHDSPLTFGCIVAFLPCNFLFPTQGIIESTFAIGMAAGPPLGGILFEVCQKK